MQHQHQSFGLHKYGRHRIEEFPNEFQAYSDPVKKPMQHSISRKKCSNIEVICQIFLNEKGKERIDCQISN